VGRVADPVVRRVLHIEDSPQMRAWFEMTVEGVEDLRVVGAAVDGLAGIELAKELQPDLIVLDQSMPRLNGTDALPLLRAACPTARVVMWTSDVAIAEAALAAGASAVVDKAHPLDELLTALRAEA